MIWPCFPTRWGKWLFNTLGIKVRLQPFTALDLLILLRSVDTVHVISTPGRSHINILCLWYVFKASSARSVLKVALYSDQRRPRLTRRSLPKVFPLDSSLARPPTSMVHGLLIYFVRLALTTLTALGNITTLLLTLSSRRAAIPFDFVPVGGI